MIDELLDGSKRSAPSSAVGSVEQLWSLQNGDRRVDCELRFDPVSDEWECVCLYNGEPVFRRLFQTRNGAFAEAAHQREELKREGWSVDPVRRREGLWPFGRRRSA
jgi:hypothetical protein